jgi:hypothetical protein
MEAKMDMVNTPTFTCFPILAVELRLKIWAFALPGPRVVEIRYDLASDKFYERESASFFSVLHVNQESRHEVLKLYAPYFGTSDHCARIWLNLTIDTVSLNYDTFKNRALGIREICDIEYLELRDQKMNEVKEVDLFRHLRVMRKMKQVVVVDPRCPFIRRPYPVRPLFGLTSWVFELDLKEFYKGFELERECADVWDKLVVLKKAFAKRRWQATPIVGMVGILDNGERRYKMVGNAE